MGIDFKLVQFANSVNFPSSYLLIGPLALALALHILRAHSGKPKTYESGKWAGVEMSKDRNSTASLLSLIFIVVFSQFSFGVEKAKAFGAIVTHNIIK